ncbi:macro domain-containing protein [Phototrophicus methaneseepsis]|uniref:Macro domain-containing protein n=1 Tax=Phototrophicus methaneseepsis TaxID=2710758 RepID=A0A7S8IG15_9CHLR|nr:macro domain-containing protein [Phototrophicus methaneseepsis]QPC84196.1 macro domain-containing protein [Phototrophicus methaneseepsis]
MPIHYIEGDLLENEHKARAFAIESNTEGLMNTQVSVQFRTRYPRLYESYRNICQTEPPQFHAGDVFVWEDHTGQVVYNLAVYANPYLTLAERESIRQSFAELRRLAEERQIDSIAMPPIAAGVGGLNWRGAKRALEETFEGFAGDVYVYMKNKSPERDLSAIQSKIDEESQSRGSRSSNRDDDEEQNSNNRRRRNRRRRSGRNRNRNKGDDSSNNQAAASSESSQQSSNQGDNSDSKQNNNNQQKNEGGSGRSRNRRGRRGRGRRGGRNRNRNKDGNNNSGGSGGSNQND